MTQAIGHIIQGFASPMALLALTYVEISEEAKKLCCCNREPFSLLLSLSVSVRTSPSS